MPDNEGTGEVLNRIYERLLELNRIWLDGCSIYASDVIREMQEILDELKEEYIDGPADD